ncbi:MAG: transglycosylase domain-containing protein, partial [Sphaerochaetaceae bacterium]|nr:transglycosylase domain-containing protein [Sphaerochaetaceae bacterium]
MIRYFLALIFILVVAISTWLLYLYSQIRADIDMIVNYNPKKTTQFFDKNGKLIANIFDKKHRLYVKYEDIPARVVEALVAIEDTQFFEHMGVNPDAISRAMIKNIKALGYVEGASTL